MPDYDNNNRFALFPETNKKRERSPDATGPGQFTCPHCGKVVELRLAAWNRTSKKDPELKFISGEIEVLAASDKETDSRAGDSESVGGIDSDIPF